MNNIIDTKSIEFNEKSQNIGKLFNANSTKTSFSDVLEQSINAIESAEQNANEDSMQLAVGNVSDLAQLQINSLKATAMVQTTSQLTTRVVNAYKEIMQMQI